MALFNELDKREQNQLLENLRALPFTRNDIIATLSFEKIELAKSVGMYYIRALELQKFLDGCLTRAVQS